MDVLNTSSALAYLEKRIFYVKFIVPTKAALRNILAWLLSFLLFNLFLTGLRRTLFFIITLFDSRTWWNWALCTLLFLILAWTFIFLRWAWCRVFVLQIIQIDITCIINSYWCLQVNDVAVARSFSLFHHLGSQYGLDQGCSAHHTSQPQHLWLSSLESCPLQESISFKHSLAELKTSPLTYEEGSTVHELLSLSYV